MWQPSDADRGISMDQYANSITYDIMATCVTTQVPSGNGITFVVYISFVWGRISTICTSLAPAGYDQNELIPVLIIGSIWKYSKDFAMLHFSSQIYKGLIVDLF